MEICKFNTTKKWRTTIENLLQKMLKKEGIWETTFNHLIKDTALIRFDKLLFGNQRRPMQEILKKRICALPALTDALKKNDLVNESLSFYDILSVYLPLAEYILTIEKGKALIIGISGGPGAGKTTLSAVLKLIFESITKKLNVVRISLDDMYYSKETRQKMGYKWRACPGTHDIKKANLILLNIKKGVVPIEIPRYDTTTDRVAESEIIHDPVDLCILEGWLIGKKDEGYEVLTSKLDYLIYLDAKLADLRRFRFEKENKIRKRPQRRNGFTQIEMKAFWNEVLGPGVLKWILPIKEDANIIIKYDKAHRVTRIHLRKDGNNLDKSY